MSKLRVLLIEHDAAVVDEITTELTRAGFRLELGVASARDCLLALLEQRTFDVILADDELPDWTGMEALALVRSRHCDTPFVLLCGALEEQGVAESAKQGAVDYVLKSNLVRLPLAITRVLAEAKLERERASAELARGMSQRKLREREQRFQQLAESISEVFFMMDASLRETLYISAAYERIWGRTLDSLYDNPLSILDQIPAPYRARWADYLARVCEGESSGDVEMRVVRPDGIEHWVLGRATPVCDERGRVSAVSGVVLDITGRKRAEDALRASERSLARSYDVTLEGWSRALDLRDKETEGHSRRVTALTLRLARTMGLGSEELQQIRRGALLHDVGKLGIPDRILLKPGPLTSEEWAVMREHPIYAFQWLSAIEELQPALEIPYCHHERWDGCGYPRGLRGEEIPFAARIFAVVDTFDALTTDRPYRAAWPLELVLDHIAKQSGKHFDPRVVEAFLSLAPLVGGADFVEEDSADAAA